jgi:ankyrin repeat protein
MKLGFSLIIELSLIAGVVAAVLVAQRASDQFFSTPELPRIALPAGSSARSSADRELIGAILTHDDGKLSKALRAGASARCRLAFTTPLCFAAAAGDFASARSLLDAGARVDAVNDAGYTPLMLAAECNHARVVRLLLERGADPQARTLRGETALDLARAVRADPQEKAVATRDDIDADADADGRGDRDAIEVLRSWPR